jgi:hypothetical protein
MATNNPRPDRSGCHFAHGMDWDSVAILAAAKLLWQTTEDLIGRFPANRAPIPSQTATEFTCLDRVIGVAVSHGRRRV